MPNRRKELKIEGSNLWYLVGLITSDGCLCKDGRHIDITSKEQDFLQEIKDRLGLMQNKSLILGEIRVPYQFFIDFLRGLIDGDGCIRRWIHPSNKREQWSLRIYSGSKDFIGWLKNATESLLKIRGKIHEQSDTQWVLKYGKMAAREISGKCYYRDCLGLDRKIKLAQECCLSYMGWQQSKTICN